MLLVPQKFGVCKPAEGDDELYHAFYTIYFSTLAGLENLWLFYGNFRYDTEYWCSTECKSNKKQFSLVVSEKDFLLIFPWQSLTFLTFGRFSWHFADNSRFSRNWSPPYIYTFWHSLFLDKTLCTTLRNILWRCSMFASRRCCKTTAKQCETVRLVFCWMYRLPLNIA